jgi:hypothetical protein
LLVWVLVVPAAFAEIPYNDQPDWLSLESNDFGTGCDFADVNGDGYLDLAVSNGNDMTQAPNYVYLNQNGILPSTATWVSDDSRYSGHCEFGDVDGDGYPELMVANYISPGWQPAQVQIYKNHAGVLETTPSWETENSFYCFRGTFGDADGDGDLDLAVATGESYYGYFEQNLIYFNVGGVLATSPGWVSDDFDTSYDVQFVDIDDDGDLDLALLTSGGPVKIYYSIQGALETTPGWVSDLPDNGNSFDFADLNGDGYLDLGVAYNSQLSGSGYFKIHYSNQGILNNSADWVSATSGYGSEAVFCDMDRDGQQDLVTGRWWGLVQVYNNDGGAFPLLPGWTTSSDYESVIENITFADVDNGHTVTQAKTFTVDERRQLFYLGERHLQGIDAVEVDGALLSGADFCYHRKNGWVSLASAPLDSVTIHFRYSPRKDMAVSNWDGSTYLFTNTHVTGIPGDETGEPLVTLRSYAYPNPFNAHTRIRYALPKASLVKLDVYDLMGAKITTILHEYQEAGARSVDWDASRLASGVYFYRLQHVGGMESGKITLVK